MERLTVKAYEKGKKESYPLVGEKKGWGFRIEFSSFLTLSKEGKGPLRRGHSVKEGGKELIRNLPN